MQQSISLAAVILHCQQPPIKTISEICALERSKGPVSVHPENRSDGGGWETPTSHSALVPPEMRIHNWNRTRRVPNLPSKPTILLSYLGTRNRTPLPNTVKK